MEPHIHAEHRLKIGVMGSASGPQIEDPESRHKARELGREIARRGHILINGACPGLPHDALLGSKDEDGFSIGISPAFSHNEHVYEYKSPHENNVIIFTGMGFMERDIINIRSSDGIVIVGGGIGTLNEFTIAYEEGRPVGVLTHSGGISDSIPYVVKELCKRAIPENIVFDDDVNKLLDKLETVIKKFPLPLHEDGRVRDMPEARRIGRRDEDGPSEAGSRG